MTWTEDHELLSEMFDQMAKTITPTPDGTNLAEFASVESFIGRPVDVPDDPMDPELLETEEHHHPDDGHDHGNAGAKSNYAWGGFQNGRIPADKLVEISKGHRLEAQAAAAWQRMVADAKKDGVNLGLTDSYRSYDQQVSVRRRKGHQVATATPGTSVHGWGRAVDANVNNPKALAWLRANAGRYGWVNPAWAQRKGKSWEPWHWEHVGGEG